MFTGIIKKVGVIKKIDPPASALSASNWRAGKQRKSVNFIIEAKGFLAGVKIGDSISCDGVCLTVIGKNKDKFKVELMPETLRATKFKNSKVGNLVNLEFHFVIGHVDGVGVVRKIINENKYINLIINVPKKIVKYLAPKGSITVNGVSLTISGVGADWFKVSLITHTLENTNLSKLKTGDKVNIEVDMIARYLENLLKK
jgi:riboflavin synthase